MCRGFAQPPGVLSACPPLVLRLSSSTVVLRCCPPLLSSAVVLRCCPPLVVRLQHAPQVPQKAPKLSAAAQPSAWLLPTHSPCCKHRLSLIMVALITSTRCSQQDVVNLPGDSHRAREGQPIAQPSVACPRVAAACAGGERTAGHVPEIRDRRLRDGAAGPRNTDCPPRNTARITSDCGAARCLSIRWP